MRKLSAKKKVKRAKAQDEDASSGVEDTNVNLEANENGGKNEESSGNESDNSKTVKRKSRKNANEKAAEADEESEKEAAKSDEEKDDDEGEEAEPEYEVKDIVDQKVEKGVTYYLIRWKGYGPDDDTWEAEDTLNCPDIIGKFKKKSAKESSKNSDDKPAKGKRGRKRKADIEPQEEEEPADPDKEWEVARIINVGYEKGIRLFRIRWKGYGPKYDTWEPEEHLNCTEMIDKFLEDMKRKEQVEQKELREKPKRTERLAGDSYRRGSKRNAGKTRTVYYEGDDE